MVGLDYSGNTSSFGRYSGLAKQPSFSGYSLFYSKYGLYAGLSSMMIGNSDSTATAYTNQYDINLGYDQEVGKFLTLSAAYSHFFYSRNSYSIQSLYKNEFQMGVNLNVGNAYSNISAYYLTGDFNEWMGSGQLGYNFEWANVFFKDHTLSISPEVGIMMGNQKYYNQYAYRNYWYFYKIAQRFPTLTAGDLIESPGNYPGMWKFLNKFPPFRENFYKLDRDVVLWDLFQTENKFNVSSISMTLPVYYTLGNFMLNLSYSLSIPLNLPEYMDDSAISYFSAGISYTFSF